MIKCYIFVQPDDMGYIGVNLHVAVCRYEEGRHAPWLSHTTPEGTVQVMD